MDSIAFYPLGDSGITIQLASEMGYKINQRIRSFVKHLEKHGLPGIVEIVPGFSTVTIYYDPFHFYKQNPRILPYDQMEAYLSEQLKSFKEDYSSEKRVVHIPVCYGGELGPDLEHVAVYNGLSPEEVIAIHSGTEYLVYMIGFAPGFPYLGGLSEKLSTPRRSSPRLVIPAGSVGIGGSQTGIYPIESPGGWQLIGRTPTKLFIPESTEPSLLLAGDTIRFYPISLREYECWEEDAR